MFNSFPIAKLQTLPLTLGGMPCHHSSRTLREQHLFKVKQIIASWIANVSCYHCWWDSNQNEHQWPKKSNTICTHPFFSTILLWTAKGILLPSYVMALYWQKHCNHTTHDLQPHLISKNRKEKNKQMERKSIPMSLPMLKTGQLHSRLNTGTSYGSLPSALYHHPAVQTDMQLPTYLCSSVPLEKCMKMCQGLTLRWELQRHFNRKQALKWMQMMFSNFRAQEEEQNST